jgi:nucleotide-binding universal stress UspA family protein
MNYKKMFFPIGGGNELEERIYGALLVAKYFKINLEILKCGFKFNLNIYKNLSIPEELFNKIEEVVDKKHKDEDLEFKELFEKKVKEVDIKISENPLDSEASVYLKAKKGLRSNIIEQESKFCDLVVAAAPPLGVTTSTFETAVLKSGKSVLMIPRTMKIFSTKSVIIGWNNSAEASRALTTSIDILKEAQRVHIVSSEEYVRESNMINDLLNYLKSHNIVATYEIVKTTRIPGQALLNAALDGNFDLIVAGAYGHRGLKEMMFGGGTRYLLENSTLPIFMSH